jgi:predicted CopG family antitoxin
MKSVNVQLSDFELNQLGLNKNTVSFSELIEIIGKKITKQSLEKSIELANKYGLSKMTMEEIEEEIKAHRNAENHIEP